MKNKLILASALLLSLPQLTLAHAGDHSEAGFLHLFTSPYHIASVVGLVALAGYFATRGKKGKVKNEKQEANKK